MGKVLALLTLTLTLTLTLFTTNCYAQLGRTDAFLVMGQNAETYTITTSDTAAKLTTLMDTAIGTKQAWNRVRAVLITVETYDARVTFGRAADQSSSLGHILAAGNSMRIPNTNMVQSMWLVSKTNGSAATLQVTLEY